MSKLMIFNHPLISHKLTLLRDKNTKTKDFREYVSEIGALISYEVTRNLKLKTITINTPLTKMKSQVLAEDVVVVPILRAGLGMVDGVTKVIPTAKIGHIGLYRDETTLQPHEYYAKLPPNIDSAFVILIDPMLATGNSAIAAINILKRYGAKSICYIGLVGAPEGIENLQTAHPDVDIYLATKDDKLNEDGYILPGLGDCGDRLFGTK